MAWDETAYSKVYDALQVILAESSKLAVTAQDISDKADIGRQLKLLRSDMDKIMAAPPFDVHGSGVVLDGGPNLDTGKVLDGGNF